MSKYTIDIPRAATLDNLFSPRAGTEIPYVSPAAQYAIFPYVPLGSPTNIVFPLQILYICRENTLGCVITGGPAPILTTQ